jgi:acetate kinase
MHVLALNFGSATLKYALFDMPRGLCAEGAVELGSPQTALRQVQAQVERTDGPAVEAVGHRVVHGGAAFTAPVVIDATVCKAIGDLTPLARHNGLALEGIEAARQWWPRVPQVAVFDTAFHARMPEHARIYAVPASWREAGLKRYGFHGLSHQHVAEATAEALAVPLHELRIVSCHLGNGASVCAIAQGHSIDTSMGLTPLEGLVMGSRCGDLDPGAFGFLSRSLGLGIEQIEQALYTEGGLKALSGLGGDMRLIEGEASRGNAQAALAMKVYAYRLRKYIGAYAAAMGGCHAVAFTGGVGENFAPIRASALEGLEFLGIELDAGLNAQGLAGGEQVRQIQARASRAKALIVRAQEQRMIARAVHETLRDSRPDGANP